MTRRAERHTLRDLTVDVQLSGDFEAAHLRGDNSALLATDTMRNTVYALAAQDPIEHLETFARRLVAHFVSAGPTVTSARVRIVERPWERLGEHSHAFQRAAGGRRVAVVAGDGDACDVEAGIDDLLVLRSTGSGWSGFLRDRYTTLPETDDRILATVVTALWHYAAAAEVDYSAAFEAARAAMLEAFGDHQSPSVQFTLYRMGEAALAAVPQIDRIHLSLPNRHHLLFDLERLGLPNDNEIFHATTEPHGLIEGTVQRGRATPPDA